MKSNEYIFIGGHRKAGTTMLLNLLDSHPDLLVYPIDLTIFYAYYPIYLADSFTYDQKLYRLDRVVFDNFKAKLLKHPKIIFNLDKMRSFFFDNLHNDKLNDMFFLTNLLVKAYCHAANLNFDDYSKIVLKETSIEIYSELLMDEFENIKIIELLRDPRDNYAALKAGSEKYYSKNGESKDLMLLSMIHRLRVSKKISNLWKRNNTSRISNVKFENLTTRKEETLEKLANFLEINFSERMLVPTFMGQSTDGNSWNGLKLKEVSSVNVNNWKNRINDYEAQIIEFHLEDIMRMHDYKLFYDDFDRVGASMEFYKWANYNLFFKDSFKDKNNDD